MPHKLIRFIAGITLVTIAGGVNAIPINQGETLDAPFDFTTVAGFDLPATDFIFNVLFEDTDLTAGEQLRVDLFGDSAGSAVKTNTFTGVGTGSSGILAGFFFAGEPIPPSLQDGVGFWRLTMEVGSLDVDYVTTRARDSDALESPLFEVVSVGSVPEPATVALLVLGVAGMGLSSTRLRA